MSAVRADHTAKLASTQGERDAAPSMLHAILRVLETGFAFRPVHGLPRDRWLWIVVGVTPFVAILWVVFVDRHGVSKAAWVSLAVWQPILEELIFRGFLHTQLARATVDARSCATISRANVLTTVLFMLVHVPHGGMKGALAVAVPSLVLGSVRDRHVSVVACIPLHVFFNAAYLGSCAIVAAS